MKILPGLFKTRKEDAEDFVNDRRRAKRYNLPLRLNYFEPLTDSHGESLTRNISRHGLRFPINTKISEGTMLQLKIEDPYGMALIPSKAKVVWIEEFATEDSAEGMAYEIGVKLLRRSLY